VYFEFDNSLQPLTFNETRKGAIEIESGWSDCGVFLVDTVAVKDYLETCDLSVEGDTNFLAMFPSMVLKGLRFQTVEMYDQNLTLGANTQHELELARSLFHGR
jgi:hypothetical protein